jgi:hypothetical protein
VLDKEDYEDFKEILVAETVNWGSLFDSPPFDWDLP